ncbi:MAG: hypothetical protein F4Y87_08315 [Synechococcus sp. SB0665_bin_28]|nr:hypothetical protein [Synechococcus sp. SB0665_bin_28]MYF19632.1 hypothetical protein [Synechococcus sp. SB0677_bin_5]MYF35754.1 hypothetical protein [Synechococcus sp. SB0678_bin_12]MYI88263.1 hypothetical protein [Synechococcus sp. SB0672_bin_10]
MSLTRTGAPDNHQHQQAVLLAHRYGLNLDEDEQEELAWIIEAMGLEEAEAECARSRAMLIRSGQLDPGGESVDESDECPEA